jgi:hypothetical protein
MATTLGLSLSLYSVRQFLSYMDNVGLTKQKEIFQRSLLLCRLSQTQIVKNYGIIKIFPLNDERLFSYILGNMNLYLYWMMREYLG